MRSGYILSFAFLCILAANPSNGGDLAEARSRANSDDAQDLDDAFFHASARALVISNVEPNKLGVGGREFRVKRNPLGKGCFVYDPRTRFAGVERNLVWWVPSDGTAYTLNSPSKMVTPGLKWPRDDGVDGPDTVAVVGYVFKGQAMAGPAPSAMPASGATFTVKEYRIYRAVIDTPMSVPEAHTIDGVARKFGVTSDAAREAVGKVQRVLMHNRWYGSPESEIRHASDWIEGKR